MLCFVAVVLVLSQLDAYQGRRPWAGLFESVTPSSAVSGQKCPTPGGLHLLAAGPTPPQGGLLAGPSCDTAPPPPLLPAVRHQAHLEPLHYKAYLVLNNMYTLLRAAAASHKICLTDIPTPPAGQLLAPP